MIIARYSAKPIAVGAFDHSVWENCEPVRIEHYWSGDLAPASRHAEARLCWSDEALHVRFVCEQHEPLIVAENPVTDRKTLGVWDRDVCEIFLAPDATHPERYFEFEAAPTGEWVDLGIVVTPTGRETDWDFQSGMTTVAKLEPQSLKITIRIPWSRVIPQPKKGDVWRVNVFRCVGPEAPERYLAWRPTRTPEPNYHVPEAFGTLRFE
ncbi:MAG TPA: carbohydrate-binding family 9-like protein [Pyrinomonadaceae bacterium]|nr:carbohydrate-binding family 9-like protein [Pyrinomonadaceae bacterium]